MSEKGELITESERTVTITLDSRALPWTRSGAYRHAGLDKPAPYLIRGHPDVDERSAYSCDVAGEALAGFRKRARQLIMLGLSKSSQSLNSQSLFSDATHGLRILAPLSLTLDTGSNATNDLTADNCVPFLIRASIITKHPLSWYLRES